MPAPRFLKLARPLAQNASSDPTDVYGIKTLLADLGHYPVPDWGVTGVPDRALFEAIREFQRDRGLKVDGVMKPDGETETALKTAAELVRRHGRNGDILLAHITPEEAKLLKAHGGAGTVNPTTGLLEFSRTDKGEDKKTGKYIWHTAGDGKVRSSHAERNGKEFLWDNPPEGGHPGEAPNCRCTAEDVDDTKKRCEELSRLIKVTEINLKNAKEHLAKAAEIFDAAQEALNTKEQECKKAAGSLLGNITGGVIVGGLTGGWKGAVRGGGDAVASSAEDIYNACINNSQEKQAYEQAKQDQISAIFWKEAYEEDLNAYREEYVQLGCEN